MVAWSETHELEVIELYDRRGKLPATDSEVVRLARRQHRTAASVAIRLANVHSVRHAVRDAGNVAAQTKRLACS